MPKQTMYVCVHYNDVLHIIVLYTYILFIYVGSCDNNLAIIGAIVGVDCTVIIIMVITNIMVWICCFRKRHYTCTICKGLYTYIHTYIVYNFTSDNKNYLHTYLKLMKIKIEKTIQAKGIDLCLLALHYH